MKHLRGLYVHVQWGSEPACESCRMVGDDSYARVKETCSNVSLPYQLGLCRDVLIST